MVASRSSRKALQRADARGRRAAMDPDYRRVAGHSIGLRLEQLVESGAVIAAYAATAEEVDLDDMVRRWLAHGHVVGLPRVSGTGHLELHRVTSLEADVEVGPLGIREPRAELAVLDPGLVTVGIVPGVAFDRSGRRIGYGGGYYDRLLPRMAGALSLGVCFEAQLLEQVVTDAHDVSVDAVVTEADVYR